MFGYIKGKKSRCYSHPSSSCLSCNSQTSILIDYVPFCLFKSIFVCTKLVFHCVLLQSTFRLSHLWMCLFQFLFFSFSSNFVGAFLLRLVNCIMYIPALILYFKQT